MKKTLTYKGFTGSVNFSEEDGVFHGKLLGISALVTFEGRDEAELEEGFRYMVDGHLEFCELEGWDPVNAPQPVQAKAARG